MKHPRRFGFSLLEVMLATTVLLGSVMVLSHLAFVGTAHMDAAEQYAAAQLACQARMNEMLAGATPIQEVRGQRIAELPGWQLTVQVSSADQPGLLALEVTASEQPVELAGQAAADTGAEAATTAAPVTGAGKRFTLVRWIVEPEGSESTSLLRGDASASVDLPAEASLFDDSSLPSDSMLPGEPMPADEPFVPEEPLLPEEPSMFDEPLPPDGAFLPEEPGMMEEPLPEF